MSRSLSVAIAFTALLASCSGSEETAPDPAASEDTTTTAPLPSANDAEPGAAPCPDDALAAGTHARSIEYDGLAREYLVMVPDQGNAVEPAPVVVDLHGLGWDMEGHVDYTKISDAVERGYVVVAAQGALIQDLPLIQRLLGDEAPPEGTPFWNVSPSLSFRHDDIGFIDAALDEVEAEVCVDPERIFITGMSNGAGMSATYACNGEHEIAAMFAVAGVNLSPRCETGRVVAVTAFHGTQDTTVPYEGGEVLGVPIPAPPVMERMQQLAADNGCDPEPVVDEPADSFERTTWTGCADGADVVLFTEIGGGHTWPAGPDATDGRTQSSLDATAIMLDWFDSR